MTSPRSAAALRGMTSLLFLVALLVVPPLALAALIGWPLPTSVPSLDALEVAARTGVSDEFIVKTLAVLAWLAWAQIALAILVEGAAAARRRPSVNLPIVPGLQAGVGRLVASIAMMVSAFSPGIAAASPPPAPVPVVAQADVTHAAEPAPQLDAAVQREYEPATPALEVATPHITVERHDSYWAIAERTLGDGHRWREIRDLNVGRTMNTGHVIQPGSDLIHAGWTLDLPTDASAASVVEATDSGPAETPEHAAPELEEVTVKDGDNFWSLAEAQLTSDAHQPTADEVAPYWQDMIEANRDRLVEPGNPDLILPGQQLCVPSDSSETHAGGPAASTNPPAEEPTPAIEDHAPEPRPPQTIEAPAAQTPTEESRVTPPAMDTQDEGDQHAPSSESSPVPIALAGFASTALAVGITQAIRRRRRAEAYAAPDAPPRRTAEKDRQVHGELIALADGVAVEDLRSCLGRLAQTLAGSHVDARPRLVQHGPDCVDIMLVEPCPSPPKGWAADGSIWSLVAEPDEPAAEGADFCAAPLLVTLGQPDEGGQFYLDLEAEGLISLVGPDDVAGNVARAILAELAFSPMVQSLQLVVVGDLAPEGLTSTGHVRIAPSWEEAAASVLAWAEQSHTALEANAWPNTFVARGHAPYHDALSPIAVVASEPPPPNLVDKLLTLRPASLSVVAVGEIEGATRVECSPDTVHVPAIGLTCSAYELDLDDFETSFRLLKGVEYDGSVQDLGSDREPSLRAEHQSPFMEDEGDPPIAEAVASDGPDDESGECLQTDDEQDEIGEGAPEQIGAARSLLEAVTSSGHTGHEQPPGAEEPLVPVPEAPPEQSTEPGYDLLVRVLGDVHVEGAEDLTGKLISVVAYIALHGEVSSERLEAAVWAGDGSHSKARMNTMGRIRAEIGERYLPTAADSRYRPGPGLVTDIELFELRVGRAANQPAVEAVETLRSALELVTGPIFTTTADKGRSSFTWVDVENWISRWELKIANAAQRCAELLLELDRPDEAVGIAERALAVMPTHPDLTEVVMRAHAAVGDANSLKRVFEAHVGALEDLDFDDPDESVGALYAELARTAKR